MYSLKDIRYFEGREGYGMNASLYKGSTQVARIHDAGDGGCIDYRFVSREESLAFDAFVLDWGKTSGTLEKRDREMAEYRDPDWQEPESWKLENVRTLWVGHAEQQVTLRKMSQDGTPFRLKGDPKGEWRCVNAPYCPDVEKWLRESYGDLLEHIHIEGEPAADHSPSP